MPSFSDLFSCLSRRPFSSAFERQGQGREALCFETQSATFDSLLGGHTFTRWRNNHIVKTILSQTKLPPLQLHFLQTDSSHKVLEESVGGLTSNWTFGDCCWFGCSTYKPPPLPKLPPSTNQNCCSVALSSTNQNCYCTAARTSALLSPKVLSKLVVRSWPASTLKQNENLDITKQKVPTML